MSLTRIRRSAAATILAPAKPGREGRHAGGGFEGVLRRHQPPHLVEVETLEASRLICRCPPWAGLNEPPSSPIRRCRRRRRSGTTASGRHAGETPALPSCVPLRGAPGRCRARGICRSSAGRADRAARRQALGGDADLGAHAELAAVGELGRGVEQHDRAVDLAQEALGGGLVLGDDRVGVVRAVALDMGDRARSSPSTTFTAMIASRYSVASPASLAGTAPGSIARDVGVAADLAAGRACRSARIGGSTDRGDRAVDQQGLGRAADRRPAASWRSARSRAPCRGRRRRRHRCGRALEMGEDRDAALAPAPARSASSPPRGTMTSMTPFIVSIMPDRGAVAGRHQLDRVFRQARPRASPSRNAATNAPATNGSSPSRRARSRRCPT